MIEFSYLGELLKYHSNSWHIWKKSSIRVRVFCATWCNYGLLGLAYFWSYLERKVFFIIWLNCLLVNNLSDCSRETMNYTSNTKSISLQGQLCSRWRAFNCISRSSLDEYKWYVFILSVFSWLLIHVGLESKDPSAEKDHVIQWKAPKQLWSGPCGKTVFHWKVKMAPQKYVFFFFLNIEYKVFPACYIYFLKVLLTGML